MIDRYCLKEMSSLWSLENRFSYMLQVEKAVSLTQAELGVIPKKAAQAINTKAQFSIKKILTREKKTRHDVTAFIEEVSSHLELEHGAYFHYGLTSSDVLDTALSLQIREASKVLDTSFISLKKALKKLIKNHKQSICCGRTHGVHAEPSTFGLKMLGHLLELERAHQSFTEAQKLNLVGKLSGAVGAYTSLSPKLEQKVCQKLKLQAEDVATQVIPRDRLARLVFSLGLLASALERLAIELRHLQRTEVAEVSEGFSKGQTGSSAMPHKKNPISAENITGLARLIKSYVPASLDNISLWHERDISHSSVERVILPDAFILSHYILNRMTKLIQNLKVHQQTMKSNLWISGGVLFSSQVLNALVAKGLIRKKAYPLVQKISHQLKQGESFKESLKSNPEVQKYLKDKEIDDLFLWNSNLKFIDQHIEKILKKKKLV